MYKTEQKRRLFLTMMMMLMIYYMYITYNNGCILLGRLGPPNDVRIIVYNIYIFYFFHFREIYRQHSNKTNEWICRNNCFYWSRSQKPVIIVPHTHSYEFGFDVVRLKITCARYMIDLPRISIKKNSLNLIVRLANGCTPIFSQFFPFLLTMFNATIESKKI